MTHSFLSMLFLLAAIAGLLLPASIERVLSATDAYDVLQLERAGSLPVKDIRQAHWTVAVKVHPDLNCVTPGRVCNAAQRAMVIVISARDESCCAVGRLWVSLSAVGAIMFLSLTIIEQDSMLISATS